MSSSTSSSRPELTRVDSFQFPSAHLGHLTEGQEAALSEFKKLCEKDGYYIPEGRDGRRYASHDDETMLRYLRARRFIPKDALKQFKDTEDWRKANKLEQLYETIDVKEYEETRRLYPQWTGRRDKRGIPIYLFEVAHLNSKRVAEYEKAVGKNHGNDHHHHHHKANKNETPVKMLRLFALYENLLRFVMPLCTSMTDRPHPETPISQSNNIVDISHVGLKQFWNLKSHMQDASNLATAHYPETLDRIFIIGAPAFFPTVWGWIKRWFDPITVSKIFILSSSDLYSTLSKYIDHENIPKKYGGGLDYEFGMMPMLEPALQEKIEWVEGVEQNTVKGQKTIPTGSIKWREGTGEYSGYMEAVAVGSVNGKQRRTVLARVNADFKGMHGVSTGNTEIDWTKELEVTTPGTATQPREEGDLYFGSEFANGTGNSSPSSGNNSGANSAVCPGSADNNNSNATKESKAESVDTSITVDSASPVVEKSTENELDVETLQEVAECDEKLGHEKESEATTTTSAAVAAS